MPRSPSPSSAAPTRTHAPTAVEGDHARRPVTTRTPDSSVIAWAGSKSLTEGILRAVLWNLLDPADSRVRSGLERMMEARSRALAAGERPVGWKIGWNAPVVRERLGVGSSVIGFMLESGVRAASEPVSLSGTTTPGAEVELAIRVGTDSSISSVGPGIELVDVHGRFDDVEAALAANIWHRGAVVGELVDWEASILDEIEVRVEHNGEPFAEPARPRDAIEDAEALVHFVAETAGSLGAPLSDGDLILTGLLVPSPVWTKPGDRVSADYGRLGRLELEFRE
jgi:2-keto-4-pentenoate hydratase